MDNFFKGVKEGVKDIADGTVKKEKLKKERIKTASEREKNRIKAEEMRSKLDDLIGYNEEILYVHNFLINKMVITNKRLIYIDTKISKNKTYHMIPLNKVTAYSLISPTGLSVTEKLQIFTGGDTPSIVVESKFNEGMREFCKILADNI